jgi:4-hydroxy-3-polyprenylbenzoate decarboxylase
VGVGGGGGAGPPPPPPPPHTCSPNHKENYLRQLEGARPIVVGITGASGAILARATIEKLLAMDVPVIVTASSAARMVWQEEMDESFGEALERWSGSGHFAYYAIGDLRAPIASGTFPTLGMAVVPCSMATLAAIAHGLADNLLRRAADVCLKERRPLVLVPRETPLNAIHLENMTSLARLGVTILPPEPPFYLKPQSIQDVVDFVAQRTLVALGVTRALPDNMQYKGPRDI